MSRRAARGDGWQSYVPECGVVLDAQQVTERLVCMDNGRIIADGKPAEVMSHPDVVRAYLGSAIG